MEPKSNLAYKYSEVLKQKIAFDRTTGTVLCEDGCTYSSAEIDLIKISQRPVPFQVHLIKKNFSGTLLKAPGN